jgi:hypothetical protein
MTKWSRLAIRNLDTTSGFRMVRKQDKFESRQKSNSKAEHCPAFGGVLYQTFWSSVFKWQIYSLDFFTYKETTYIKMV